MKKWLATLLTVVMIVALVPFSAISAFAADSTDPTTHAALNEALAAANSGDTVKLGANITTEATRTIKAGVTLDLNGYKLGVTGVNVLALKSRVIDSAPGEYEFYKTINTTGKQYVSMGLKVTEVTGFQARTSSDRAYGNSSWESFIGAQTKTGGTTGTAQYWIPLGLASGTTGNGALYFRMNYDTTNKTVSTTFGDPNPAVGEAFDYEYIGLPGKLYASVNGTAIVNITAVTNVPPTDWYDASAYLLGKGGANQAMYYYGGSGTDYTTCTTVMNPGEAANTFANGPQYGKIGWHGKTEYAKVYSDAGKGVTENTNLVRSYVPAKSKTTGMMGMFDMVEGVFYPLLGDTQYATFGAATGASATINADGSVTYNFAAFDAAELTAALVSAPAGATIRLMADIEDTTVAYTVSTGVTIDLNGHKFAYKSFDAKTNDAVKARVIDSAAGNYELYDYIFTNGRQFLPTGVASYEVSGVRTKFTFEKPNADTGNVTLFGGYYKDAGGTVSRFQLIDTSAGTKGDYNDIETKVRFSTMTGATPSPLKQTTYHKYVAGAKSGNSYVETKSPIEFDLVAQSGNQKWTYISGIKTGDVASDKGTIDVYNNPETAFNMNLFNYSINETWSALTLKSGYQWSGLEDQEQGRNGWYGKVYYFNIYNDIEDAPCDNTNAIREYVPAKSETGAIGMFDKVEGVFYPLLGLTQYADLGTATGCIATVAEDGKVTYNYSANDYTELANVMEFAKSGETVNLTGDITLGADVNGEGIAFVLGNDVTLDLNGYAFTYGAIELGASVGCRVIDSSVVKYKEHEYLFTDGTQFITTGLNMSEISGLYAETTLDRTNPSGNTPTFFGAYVYEEGSIRRFQPLLQVANSNKIRVGWVADSATIHTKEIDLTESLGEKFTFNFWVDQDGYVHDEFGGAISDSNNDTATKKIYDRALSADCQVNLLNVGGVRSNNPSNFNYASMTQDIAKGEDPGLRGWYGKTYAAKIYTATDGSANTTEPARDFVPAEADGVKGMFDKANDTFYPLLGWTDGASFEEMDPVAEAILGGENATLEKDVDLTGEGQITISNGQEINLGDYDLKADAVMIEADAVITGEGTITTNTLVVIGDLEKWLPVEIDEGVYQFVDTSDGMYNNAEDATRWVAKEDEKTVAASVFALTEQMQDALADILADESYEIYIKAAVVCSSDVELVDKFAGTETQCGGNGDTLELEFNVTEMLRNAMDEGETIEDFFAQFSGIHTGCISSVTCTAEVRNGNFAENLDNFARVLDGVVPNLED